MEYRTIYTKQEPAYSVAGDPVLTEYGGHYDEAGRIVLEEVGKVNLYDEIQSHAESVDIHTIMKRYANGDPEALSRSQGFFGDFLDFPKTYAEALNHMNEMERNFDHLPVEVKQKFGNSFAEFLASSNDADFAEKIGLKLADQVVDKVADVKLEKEVVKE